MLATVDVAILLGFLVYAAAIGLRSRKVSSQNLDEYFLAGRTLPGWKAGISMAATQFAADTPLLVTGMIATAGLFSLWQLWIYGLAFLFMGFVLAGPWRRARVLTDAELAELRYGSRLGLVLRVAKAFYFGTLFNCAVMAMVLLAATRIAEPFLTWERWLPAGAFERLVDFVEWLGVPLSVGGDPALWAQHSASNLLSLAVVIAVTLLYSTTGGLRAVVSTDVVQFAVAMIATAVYAVIVVERAGGLGAIAGHLRELYGAEWARQTLALTPSQARDASWPVVGVIAIQWLAQMNADGTGYLAQRTMACRSDADARRAAVVFTVLQVLLRSLLWMAIGLGLLVLLPASGTAGAADTAAREATFVDGIVAYLPAGARGLMLAGMLAALASTLDTHLNWGGSYWTNDLYRRVYCQVWRKREPTARTLVWVARASNGLILLVALLILPNLSSIQSAWRITLLLGAGMGVPLVLRWVWWRVTAAGELAAIVVSTAGAPLLLATLPGDGSRVLAISGLTTLIVVVMAHVGPREPVAGLEAFYRRVRPPGFWGPIARACGDDPAEPARRLRDGLITAGALALAIFSALVAAATWLFEAPAPTWFPGRAAWIAALLVTGALMWRVAAASARRSEGATSPGA